MSEPVMQRLKISREGLILIKSFEGFRPRAERREGGGWVIGYGHIRSAREGAVVTEAEAELLLQFDLMEIGKALNAVERPLNQHQFDALASFACSVGLERFQASDVLARLTSGATRDAADAMLGWTDPQPVISPVRRRTAERALFVADPGRSVGLAELLGAPLSQVSSESETEASDIQPQAPSPQRFTAYAANVVGPLPGPFPTIVPIEISPPSNSETITEAQAPAAVEPDAEPSIETFEDEAPHQTLRREGIKDQPVAPKWRETGLYVIMSVFGLLTFGLSVVAFRRASLIQGGPDLTTVAWVLAVFGFGCIAISAWNLYRKLARRED